MRNEKLDELTEKAKVAYDALPEVLLRCLCGCSARGSGPC